MSNGVNMRRGRGGDGGMRGVELGKGDSYDRDN